MERGAAFLSETITSPTVRRRHAQLTLSQDVGVGFWTKGDAEAHAKHRRARTGLEWVLAEESSPFGTRSLWFVRLASAVRAVA